MPACSEVSVDAILDHGESLLLEAATRFVREPLVAQIEERRASPERERLGSRGLRGARRSNRSRSSSSFSTRSRYPGSLV